MSEITQENFSFVSPDGKPTEKNSQVAFWRKHPDMFLMIHPDRQGDLSAHRYSDANAKKRGDKAMKAWFEYLAGKGFITTFNTWRSMLKSGKSIMVVCDDPGVFDTEFVPPRMPVLAPDFWDKFEQSRVPIDRRFDTPEERARLAKIAKDCAASMRVRVPKPQPQQAGFPVQESKPSPPLMSDELLAKLGILDSKAAAE